jgi:site-specific recombinase XerC
MGNGETMLSQDLIVAPTQGRPPALIESSGRKARDRIEHFKQHMAAIRMLFDHLVTGAVLEHNPALSVKAPRQKLGKGKTPVLTAEEAGDLLRSIVTDNVVGLQDRALIGVMVFTFARVSAA